MSRNNWTDDKLIDRLLTNTSDKTYWDNIAVLRSRPSDYIFEKCVYFIKSDNPKENIVGIDTLAQLGVTPRQFYKQTIELYFEQLEIVNDPKILMTLLYAIGHNNDKLSKLQIEKLCSFSGTSDNLIKEGLVFSLLGIDNILAIETLIKLSTDKLSYIRDWATFGIGTQIERNNKDIRQALWNRVNDKHQETKLEAIVGLARRKDSRVNDIIRRELLAGEFGTLLFEAIEVLGDIQFLPLLQQNLETAENDKGIDREWVEDLKACIENLIEKNK